MSRDISIIFDFEVRYRGYINEWLWEFREGRGFVFLRELEKFLWRREFCVGLGGGGCVSLGV